MQSQLRFNTVPEKVPEKVPALGLGGFGAEPDQVHTVGFGEGSGEGFRRSRFNGFCRRFWTRPGRLCCRAVSEKVLVKIWEGLEQRQSRFNGSEVPEKVPGGFVQGRSASIGFRRRFRRRPGRLWSRLRCFQRLASQHASEIFVKIKRCGGCWGSDTMEAYF